MVQQIIPMAATVIAAVMHLMVAPFRLVFVAYMGPQPSRLPRVEADPIPKCGSQSWTMTRDKKKTWQLDGGGTILAPMVSRLQPPLLARLPCFRFGHGRYNHPGAELPAAIAVWRSS
jgi:hypothetical protein